jgi:hypothetical protein
MSEALTKSPEAVLIQADTLEAKRVGSSQREKSIAVCIDVTIRLALVFNEMKSDFGRKHFLDVTEDTAHQGQVG